MDELFGDAEMDVRIIESIGEQATVIDEQDANRSHKTGDRPVLLRGQSESIDS